jgi:hypothetical protein
MLVVFLGFLAFSIDLGYVCVVRAEAQNAADSAALAAGQELLCEDRLRGHFDVTHASARKVAARYAGFHPVGSHSGQLDVANDVIIGRLDDPTNPTALMDQSDPANYNALHVVVRATEERGTESPFFFAAIFGNDTFDMEASATVAFADRVSGFRAMTDDDTTSLLPFTVDVGEWKRQLNNDWNDDDWSDDWTYDAENGTVTEGADGVPELRMYPIDSGSGNWGTLNIGNSNNSTAVLERQIRDGATGIDLAEFDGVLELDSFTKSLTLNGDTGISSGMKDAVADIIGQPRTMPLYRTAEGNGDTLNYEIVGFAGVRIMDADLTGNVRYLLIQPAYVVDPTAISKSWSDDSYFVTQPLRLVR